MLSASWLAELQTAISQWPKAKVAVVGIGNELRGDDAAGLLVARSLVGDSHCLVIEAGTAPENHTGALRRFQPDLVLLIDAAQINQAPGEIRLFDLDAVDGFGASTHMLPLALLAQYLQVEFRCVVLGIGIQPRSLDFGASLSAEVWSAVAALASGLQTLLASA